MLNFRRLSVALVVAASALCATSANAFNYILNFDLTPKEDWAADIAGFGADDTVTEFTPAAKAQLGTWDTKFDDDYAAWFAALPPPAPVADSGY